jgi:hypothetical protein
VRYLVAMARMRADIVTSITRVHSVSQTANVLRLSRLALASHLRPREPRQAQYRAGICAAHLARWPQPVPGHAYDENSPIAHGRVDPLPRSSTLPVTCSKLSVVGLTLEAYLTKGRETPGQAVLASQWTYVPPPLDACTAEAVPIKLPEKGHTLRVWYASYRNLIVNFRVEQIIRADSQLSEVAAVACEDGQIRRYQYTRVADAAPLSTTLCAVPSGGSWEFVDRHYEEALLIMQDEWEDNLRRWNGDSA